MLRALMQTWPGRERWLVLGGTPVYLLLFMWTFVIRTPGHAYAGPLPPLTEQDQAVRDALERHVRVLSDSIGERNQGAYQALLRASAYLAGALAEAGYPVDTLAFRVGPHWYYNLEVTVPGTSAEESIVVGAHYDTAEGTPGADDNASGTAALLELARQFAGARPARTIRFVCFPNEEPPFFATEQMGSWVYAARAAARGDRIPAMISLESIGYYSTAPKSQRYPFPFNLFYPDRGDFIAFVGNLGSRRLMRDAIAAFRQAVPFPSQGAAVPAWIPGVSWSDHQSFWLHGYRAIMITDTAPFRNPNYHQPGDTADRLDFDRMARVVGGLAAVIQRLAGS
ncbi:MAG: M28 family peptidase [Gemmatimonadetes bacterium]|nr:M28 family peptidase [Gemmatimonadota bacterium]